MNTTHTPGPWIVSPTKHRTLIVSELGFHVAATEEVSDADARLIASAPDLLNMLEEALEAIEYFDEHEGASDLLDAARAAIAKATGEQA